VFSQAGEILGRSEALPNDELFEFVVGLEIVVKECPPVTD
jgi:hypothetical protein